MTPDPKPPPRVRDPGLLRRLHVEWRECALCGSRGRLSLHHIHRHPRDDVRANLIMLCGSGTSGCHGQITAERIPARADLGAYILANRPDTMAYLNGKLGRAEAEAWLRRRLYAGSI